MCRFFSFRRLSEGASPDAPFFFPAVQERCPPTVKPDLQDGDSNRGGAADGAPPLCNPPLPAN